MPLNKRTSYASRKSRLSAKPGSLRRRPSIVSQNSHGSTGDSFISASSTFRSSRNSYEGAMADGLNQARALRVLEIMNDFRTVQLHISSHVSRAQSNPPDSGSYYADGYVVMRQCSAEAQAILATHFNPGNLGLQGGHVGEGESEKATLQRIILDAATRRFQAHKIYLRAAAATRWAQTRQQILRGEKPNGRHANALRANDSRLRDELHRITDDHVVGDLRGADRRAGHWLDEDPSLDRMLSWIRMQR